MKKLYFSLTFYGPMLRIDAWSYMHKKTKMPTGGCSFL